MPKRHAARAARRVARRLEKAAQAHRPTPETSGPAAGLPTNALLPTDALLSSVRITEVVYADPDRPAARPRPASLFSDGDVAPPESAGGVTLGSVVDGGLFSDAPVATGAAAGLPGTDYLDGRAELPPAGEHPGHGNTWQVNLVDGATGRPAGWPPVPVETYLNLGTEWDYTWFGPVMDRRPDGPVRAHPSESDHVSTDDV